MKKKRRDQLRVAKYLQELSWEVEHGGIECIEMSSEEITQEVCSEYFVLDYIHTGEFIRSFTFRKVK